MSQSDNLGALALYEKLGFARDEKLARYYLNGGGLPCRKIENESADPYKEILNRILFNIVV